MVFYIMPGRVSNVWAVSHRWGWGQAPEPAGICKMCCWQLSPFSSEGLLTGVSPALRHCTCSSFKAMESGFIEVGKAPPQAYAVFQLPHLFSRL